MKQVNLKSDRVAELLERIVERTGETKVDAVTQALERRLRELDTEERAGATLGWLEREVWSRLPEDARGRAPSKEEQEWLLGF